MRKAYSYLRFSRAEQAHGHSKQRQNDKRDAYLAAHPDLVLDTALTDEGVSAYRGKHATEGALATFLAAVESGQVVPGSVLIVESLDRLSREDVDTALVQLLSIIRAGVTVVTTMDNQVYSRSTIRDNPGPLLMSITVMWRANEESKSKGERVRDAWDKKRLEATTERKPMTARLPTWLRLSDNGLRIEPIPERAAIVQRIFAETIAGIGRHTITKRLNQEGVPTFNGGRHWHDSAVQKTLNNEAVFGRYQPYTRRPPVEDEATAFNKDRPEIKRMPIGQPIDNYYPVVVSEEDFWRAKALRSPRKGHGGGISRQAVNNLFTGFCKCGICGGTVIRMSKGPPPKGGNYLVCDAARSGACSNKKAWRYDQTEAAVLGWLDKLDVSQIIDDSPDGGAANRVAALEAQLGDVERRQKRALDLYEDGDDMARERYRALSTEAKRLGADLAKARGDLAQEQATAGSPEARLAAIRRLRAALATDDESALYTTRAALAQELRRCIRNIAFHPRHVAVLWGTAARKPQTLGYKEVPYIIMSDVRGITSADVPIEQEPVEPIGPTPGEVVSPMEWDGFAPVDYGDEVS